MTRILKKSHDRVLGGVLGGIADYLGLDYTLVRLGYVLLTFLSAAFPGVLVYLVLWFIMPE